MALRITGIAARNENLDSKFNRSRGIDRASLRRKRWMWHTRAPTLGGCMHVGLSSCLPWLCRKACAFKARNDNFRRSMKNSGRNQLADPFGAATIMEACNNCSKTITAASGKLLRGSSPSPCLMGLWERNSFLYRKRVLYIIMSKSCVYQPTSCEL